jgi:hypothetical protein
MAELIEARPGLDGIGSLGVPAQHRLRYECPMEAIGHAPATTATTGHTVELLPLTEQQNPPTLAAGPKRQAWDSWSWHRRPCGKKVAVTYQEETLSPRERTNRNSDWFLRSLCTKRHR